MKYIIMCGGVYDKWTLPRQLFIFQGETLVARIIRLLKKNGVKDIAISSNLNIFEGLFDGIPVLKHENNYHVAQNHKIIKGYWHEAFYPTTQSVCYIFGDVVFSQAAIEKIVNTKTNDIEFFASAPPFTNQYIKEWAQPFAIKVVNLDKFWKAINKVEEYDRDGVWRRRPIIWELWQVIKKTPLNIINYENYVIINDYTCDIDDKGDLQKIIKAKN